MDRRTFILTVAGAAAAVCSGCASTGSATGSLTAPAAAAPVEIGTAADYPRDGIYDRFARHRFFVLRRAGQITAVSAVCTHRNCTVQRESDEGLVCPCHGARFDGEGRVTAGPATHDLPRLRITEDAGGRLFVHAI
jgi:cytochrome b6-f complex iron-sulfur subunit